MTEIVEFDYGDEDLATFCKERARRIRAVMRRTVEDMIQIGQMLQEVKAKLPYGQWTRWVEAHFPGSVSSAERARKLARFVEKWPVLREVESVEVALEIPRLEPEARDRVLAERAFTWARYGEVVTAWNCEKFLRGVDECMADDERRYGDRLGDVMQWTKDGLADERVAPAAREVYERYREEFARHSDRSAPEMDAEVGYRPAGAGGQWAAHEPGEGLWICRRTEQGWEPVAPIGSKVMLWPGPRLALALVDDGPATAAWQAAVMDTVSERLPIRSLRALAAEVASVYGEVL